ncbi:peptidoglycan bridge formation glycyltransferase FemA/FemB family protein [Candidatus Saccharibacteria bacterium]|nr:peptidoglycan bridge formation glycyltransferase FemA/FemB family protein [Candidatus Saccharibacteria bacterium]
MSRYTITSCNHRAYTTACQNVAKKLEEPIPFLQAPLYGAIQTANGKSVIFFMIERDTELVGCGLAVVYSASGGLNFLYSPYGPMSTVWDEKLVAELRTFFTPIAHDHGCSFMRIDADGMHTVPVIHPIPDKIARTASLQPRAEWVLDITMDEDALWMGFHKHARYNVRLAERAGADIRLYSPSEAPLDTFYKLMQTTGHRDSFGIFDKSYYDSYLRTLDGKEGFVAIVYIEGKPAAAGLFVLYDKQVHYVFAGSSNDFRKIAPAYSVIWIAIQEAKKRSATLFNFGGIIDEVKGQHLSGVTSFKKRFGGYRTEHNNPIDLVYKPWRYRLFKLYKTLR